MRWLSSKAPLAAFPRLQDFFLSKTHVCLVMEQLYQSLLDVIVQASKWNLEVLLQNVRGVAIHLLVSTLGGEYAQGECHSSFKAFQLSLI